MQIQETPIKILISLLPLGISLLNKIVSRMIPVNRYKNEEVFEFLTMAEVFVGAAFAFVSTFIMYYWGKVSIISFIISIMICIIFYIIYMHWMNKVIKKHRENEEFTLKGNFFYITIIYITFLLLLWQLISASTTNQNVLDEQSILYEIIILGFIYGHRMKTVTKLQVRYKIFLKDNEILLSKHEPKRRGGLLVINVLNTNNKVFVYLKKEEIKKITLIVCEQ